MKKMKTLKFSNQEEAYEIVDAYAREELELKQAKFAGTEGQIVGFDADGNAVATTAEAALGITTESWTFELEDGTTITKQVAVSA